MGRSAVTKEETVGATARHPGTTKGERGEQIGPLLIIPAADRTYGERTDVIIVEVDFDEGATWLTLPQFGIEICGDSNEGLMTDLFRRILSFYAGLRDLPQNYINDVEREQIALIEELFLPWLAVTIAKNPAYFAAPPMGAHLTGHRLHETSA